MLNRTLWIVFFVSCGVFFCDTNPATAKKDDYTKQEVRLSAIPKYRFRDRRMRKIFKKMVRQYKLIYEHAAADSYILPNELKDLKFQRGFMYRLFIIDRRYRKAKIEYRKFKRKTRLKYRRLRRRYRRLRRRYRRNRKKRKRLRKPVMTISEKQRLVDLKKQHARYDAMIKRFACRYLPRYKRRYRKSHCRKRY